MRARVNLRRALTALAVALSAIVATAPTAQTQLMPVRVSVLPIAPMAPFYAAIQEGSFTAEGLAVTTESSQQGGSVGIPGLVAGAYDIAFSNVPTNLLAIQQGIDLRIIAVGSTQPSELPDLSALLARKADGLRSGKDLEGKTIGVNARNNVQWLFARAWVKATGGDPDKATYREVPLPQMLDALKAKQVDAVLLIDPFLTVGRRDPAIEVLGWPFYTVMPGVQVAHYVTTAEIAARRPELIRKFLRGLRKGDDWVNANVGKEPFFKLVAGFTKIDLAVVAAMPFTPAPFMVDPKSLRKIAELMYENGLLTAPIDPVKNIFEPQ
jgi:NitT/TauT family transport system substrate-binding protein